MNRIEALKQNIRDGKYTNKLPSWEVQTMIKCCNGKTVFSKKHLESGQVFCSFCGKDIKKEFEIRQSLQKKVKEDFIQENTRLNLLFENDLLKAFDVKKEKESDFQYVKDHLQQQSACGLIDFVDLLDDEITFLNRWKIF